MRYLILFFTLLLMGITPAFGEPVMPPVFTSIQVVEEVQVVLGVFFVKDAESENVFVYAHKHLTDEAIRRYVEPAYGEITYIGEAGDFVIYYLPEARLRKE